MVVSSPGVLEALMICVPHSYCIFRDITCGWRRRWRRRDLSPEQPGRTLTRVGRSLTAMAFGDTINIISLLPGIRGQVDSPSQEGKVPVSFNVRLFNINNNVLFHKRMEENG